MNCNVAIVWMHDYLDGDMPRDDVAKLKTHLIACPACRARFEQLQQTEAMAFGLVGTTTVLDEKQSAKLTDRIMSQLPVKRSKTNSFATWIRRHPAITVAAVFAFVMFASFAAMFEQDNQLSVSGVDLAQVVIDGDTVTVPEGAHVKGDLTIQNGKANVLGDVEGNVTVIDGQLYQASTAHIAGQVKQIDQALDWFWYKVTKSFSDLAY